MSRSPSPHIGSSLFAGRYRVERRLGAGSLGTVYLAFDERQQKNVALKLVRAERLNAAAVKRLQHEFQAVAALRHPQIARAHDFGYVAESGFPFYTSEYVAGSPLPPGPPRDQAPREFLRPLLDLLDAVSYLHEHDLLHLDIHPGNLIVADDPARGGVLIDFGFQSSLDPPTLSKRTDSWMLMPPELRTGTTPTPRSDIFLAGKLLFFRITGRLEGEPRLPGEVPGWGPRLTLDIERIIAKAVATAPEDRFESAREFLDAVLGALGQPAQPRQRGKRQDVTYSREKDLDAIESCLSDAAAGDPSVLVFVAERGLGKTQLLHEARLRAQLRGLEVVEVPFASPSRPTASMAKAFRRLGRKGRRGPAWLQPLEPRHGGTPKERAQRAACAYFAQDDRPLVLLLDDIDRADPESVTLVHALRAESLRRRAARLKGRGLSLLLTRSTPDTERRHVIMLSPLTNDDTRRLFSWYLRPLAPPESLLRKVVRAARGSPLRVRHYAQLLEEEWGRRGVIPDTAELPAWTPDASPLEDAAWRRLSPLAKRTLEALAVLDRAADARELAHVLRVEKNVLSPALRDLSHAGLVATHGRGRARRYHLGHREASARLLGGVSESHARELHRRLVEFIESSTRVGTREVADMARHTLAAGDVAKGVCLALQVATPLARSGSFEEAFALLELAETSTPDVQTRLELAETRSSLLESFGDHAKGIEVLAPYHSLGDDLPASVAVSLRRRLGVHYHRAGDVEKARQVFEEARRLADPERDVEDLIFISSELAELHIFRGSFAAAEEACAEGLEQLGSINSATSFRSRMEVVLRASLGHLHLRQLDFSHAREELEGASNLARRFATTAEQAAILVNLGIARNQSNDFRGARACFRRAERQLLKSGERLSLVKVAANLGIIAAKLGEREEAHLQIERAHQAMRDHPGQPLEFSVVYARGVAANLLGEFDRASESLTEALALGRALGDEYLVRFGEVYLAEAHLAAGRCGLALAQLEKTARVSEKSGPPILSGMTHSRLYVLYVLLGRHRLAARTRNLLKERQRTDVVLLEAWNDIFVALGDTLGAAPGAAVRTEAVEEALAIFVRLGVPAGQRCARLLRLAMCLHGESPKELPHRLRAEVAESKPGDHGFLAVAEPFLYARCFFALGEFAEAETWLGKASSAIVGLPFLELDLQIELLRASLALRHGELRESRRHLHRSVHTRDLLLERVPAKSRVKFLEHDRFAAFQELTARVSRPSPQLHYSTATLRGPRRYEGMVGQSPPMVRLFQELESLRDHDLPVLIQGETGTGKELVAHAIHRRSLRQERAFFPLHCASLPPGLFESELFGYKAGAFTEATEDRPGLLETLDGGTLLLDEVDQLPRASQGTLLQFLDSGAFRRVGDVERRKVDVRILASTSHELASAVQAGEFRAELFHRLNALVVRLPPLRDRQGDLSHLVKYFLEEHAARLDRAVTQWTPEALALLETYPWPGNVRELENVLFRAVLPLAEPEALEARDLAPFLTEGKPELFDRRLLSQRPLQDLHEELDREYLVELFRRVGGDTEEMMRILGVKRSRLYAWLRRLGIDVRKLRKEL